MAGWYPTFQLLVAFNNAVFDDPALITTVATPVGTLGAHNVWTDVTPWVRDQVDTNRGRQHEIDRVQTGTLTVTLDDRDGRFDQWNTTGPYTGLIVPGKPVQLRATDPNTSTVAKLFTGVTDVFTTGWPEPRKATVQLSCVDWYAYLTNIYLRIPNTYNATILAGSSAPLTAYWRLDDPLAASTVIDSGGGFFNGTVVGTPTFAIPGPFFNDTHTACNFGHVGAFSGSVTTPVTVSINAVSFNVEAWVQMSNTPPAQTAAVWTCTGSGVGFTFGLDTHGRPVLGGPSGSLCTAPQNVCDGAWHYLVCTWAGGTGGVTQVYVDNVLAATGNATCTAVADTQNLGVNFPGQIADIATYTTTPLSAADINSHYGAGLGAPVESSGARVTRVCGWANIPTAHATIDGGKSNVQASVTDLTQTAALSYLQLVEQTEDGLLYVDGTGQIRFMSRDTVYGTTTSTVTFGDGGGAEIPFQLAPTIAVDTLDTYIKVTLQRNGGTAQTADSGQLGKYYNQSGLLQTSDTEVDNMAIWLLNQFDRTPQPRIRGVTIHPVVTPTGAATSAILGLELGSVVTVNRHTLPGAGTAFTQICNVEGINHHIYPATADWNVDLQLTPLPPQQPWLLGTGQLGTTTTLFF